MADSRQTSPSTSELEEELARRPELTQLQAVITTCTTELLSESRSNNEDTSRVQRKCHDIVQLLIAKFDGHPLDSRDPFRIEIIDCLYQLCGAISIALTSQGVEVNNLSHDLCQDSNIELIKWEDNDKIKVNVQLPSSQKKVVEVILKYDIVEHKAEFCSAKCL